MPSRRQSTLRPHPASASDFPKTLELEDRLSRLELRVTDLQGLLETAATQLAALRAELDHISARLGLH